MRQSIDLCRNEDYNLFILQRKYTYVKIIYTAEDTHYRTEHSKSCPLYTMVFNLGTMNIWAQIILCCEDSPVHCRIFSGILCLYPLDSSVIPCACPHTHTTKTVSRQFLNVPERLNNWHTIIVAHTYKVLIMHLEGFYVFTCIHTFNTQYSPMR